MANIIDYINSYGKYTFMQKQFNEVDNVIFSQIAYIDFMEIAPPYGTEAAITIKEASKLYFNKHPHTQMYQSKEMFRFAPLVLEAMAKSARFQNARIYDYINDCNTAEEKQFSAVCIELDDHTVYVSFRGTDNNMVSWKEDFDMSYKTIASQTAALNYLQDMIQDSTRNYRVGGHSKGGNLAVYAAAKISSDHKKNIISIYNNDGPGFSKEFLESENYIQIKDKVKRITPEYSVVGMLFEYDDKQTVVSSDGSKVLQHDLLTWKVNGNHFSRKDELCKSSRLLSTALNQWIEKIDHKKRRALTESLFNAFEKNGIKQFTDIVDGGAARLAHVMVTMNPLTGVARSTLLCLAGTMIAVYIKGYFSFAH